MACKKHAVRRGGASAALLCAHEAHPPRIKWEKGRNGVRNMNFFGECACTEQSLRHGGIEVLHLAISRPVGESPAERHVCALCDALARYAEQTLHARAAAALECAVREGRGFSFVRYTYRVSHTVRALFRGLCVCVECELAQGDAVLERGVLVTRWTRDGRFQLRCLRARK